MPRGKRGRYKRKPVAERFWSKVCPEPMSGCWLWTAGLNNQGYGQFGLEYTHVLAHRMSWTLSFGDPGALNVLHKCDTPACVNPDHLFLGTQADNVEDMVSKGRARFGAGAVYRGSANSTAKLTEQQVLEIRESRLSNLKTAAAYGVSGKLVFLIKHRRIWCHV